MMMRVSYVTYSTLMKFGRVFPIVSGIGMRHGAPLPPYLFILVTKGISSLIHKLVSCGAHLGVKVC